MVFTQHPAIDAQNHRVAEVKRCMWANVTAVTFCAFLECLRDAQDPMAVMLRVHRSKHSVSCVHFNPCSDSFPALPAAQYDDVNGHSELLIERVSKEDSGTYVCSAENTVGSIKAIGFVYVKGT